MATYYKSNLCSICSKPTAKSFCIGCKKYFCRKDFKEHEQQLSITFDNEIVGSHDELLDLIQKLEKSNYLSLHIFDQIEQWKQTTINKVKKAAEKAQHELIQLIENQKLTIIKQLKPITKEIRSLREDENIVETNIDRLRKKINEMRQKLEKFTQKDINKSVIVSDEQIDWNRLIYISQEQQQKYYPLRSPPTTNIHPNTRWQQNAITVAGGNQQRNRINQLSYPRGLYIDDDQTIYVAEEENHRIIEWKWSATSGQVVAGGNGQGREDHQLNRPYDVIIDK
ncbi:unnamed protein product [Rotaria sp. Silwood2]|nr:unnamed protein product [Rotaria sp. Silwood2]